MIRTFKCMLLPRSGKSNKTTNTSNNTKEMGRGAPGDVSTQKNKRKTNEYPTNY